MKEVIDIYESFENLDEAKKQTILNAGFRIFGEYGYSKASIKDIIKEAGISKGSLFYYFESKKNYFLYLYEYTSNIMKHLVDDPGEDGLPKYLEKTDFFERLDDVKERKMKLAFLHPYMGGFIKKAPFERSQDVYKEIQLINQRLAGERIADFFDKLDIYKFKDGVDPKMVLQLISWCSEGAVSLIQTKNLINPQIKHDELDYKEVIQLYDRYVAMIKKHFYKEEYL
ncbi:MAG: TetR/AcrR family transcriptional regulator [Anaerolineaceae bacterium]|nr:MAG: TetR/AcrR family transcriptional regulator [Anaerolineaceae bacterium]